MPQKPVYFRAKWNALRNGIGVVLLSPTSDDKGRLVPIRGGGVVCNFVLDPRPNL